MTENNDFPSLDKLVEELERSVYITSMRYNSGRPAAWLICNDVPGYTEDINRISEDDQAQLFDLFNSPAIIVAEGYGVREAIDNLGYKIEAFRNSGVSYKDFCYIETWFSNCLINGRRNDEDFWKALKTVPDLTAQSILATRQKPAIYRTAPYVVKVTRAHYTDLECAALNGGRDTQAIWEDLQKLYIFDIDEQPVEGVHYSDFSISFAYPHGYADCKKVWSPKA